MTSPSHSPPALTLTLAQVIEVGNQQAASKPTERGAVGRVDIDCFLYRALEHYTSFEDLEEEMLIHAYKSWDFNDDGMLQHNEFLEMVRFANPAASMRKVTRAFVLACGGAGDVIEKERLAPILIAYGFSVKERPADYVAPSEAPAASNDRAILGTMSQLSKAGMAFRVTRTRHSREGSFKKS